MKILTSLLTKNLINQAVHQSIKGLRYLVKSSINSIQFSFPIQFNQVCQTLPWYKKF